MTEENEMIATFFKLPFLAQADFIGDATANTLLMLSLTFIELALSGGVIYLFYFLLTLPMRRNERTRLCLDLMELGLKEGRSPSQAIMEASSSHDTAPGVRFHLLAAHLERGLKFSDALAKVPRLLPPQIVAMLKAGERIGDLAKVLPACRKLLTDGVSQVRSALNYLLILTLAVTPLTIYVPVLLNIFVIPRYKEIFADMRGGQPLPAFTIFVVENGRYLLLLQLGILALMWLLMAAYLGGPRFLELARRRLPVIPDRVLFRFPWRRKRLQRDFSAMLAVLLDAGVPEAEAVTMAAAATTNGVLQHRAAKVCALLNSGVKLPEAIREVDDCAELRWRISNALQRGGNFMQALNGWHESLDAKAFQLEQTAAQILTSALVLLNGLFVAAVVIGLFLPLIALLNQATLW